MTSPVLTKQELLQRVAEGWREFRGQVRHLGIAGIRERTPVGWTYKDLVAHVAAWEEHTVPRLRALAAGDPIPHMTDAEVDAFNARAVDERRLVGAEAIVDELETAHRLLVTLLHELPDDLLRTDRAQQLVAANTFGHYEEHRSELLAPRQAP